MNDAVDADSVTGGAYQYIETLSSDRLGRAAFARAPAEAILGRRPAVATSRA